jgi:serine/threonine-protein kinase
VDSQPNKTCPRCGSPLPPGALCVKCSDAAIASDAAIDSGGTFIRESPFKDAPGAQEPLVLGDNWVVEGTLGQGGMGTVYRARDKMLDRPVAVKMMSVDLSSSTEFVARFEREAKLMAKLEHPNIVPIYFVGRHGKTPFIVMKHLEGQTLAGYQAELGGRLTPEQAYPVLKQMCAALSVIHARGFVHRDIKPGNIFVGPDGHVTLLDLGIARNTTDHSFTRSGVMVGTPAYMSPEQILGTTQIDGRTDIYAVGTVLHEMLTGAPPFHGDSEFSIMRAHQDTPPPDASTLNPDVSPEIALVIQKALAKAQADRFANAQELITAYEAALGGVAIPATFARSTTHPGFPAPGTARTPRPSGVHPAAPGMTSGVQPSPSFGRHQLLALVGVAVVAIGGTAVVLWPRAPQVEPVTLAASALPAPAAVPAPAPAPAPAAVAAPVPIPAPEVVPAKATAAKPKETPEEDDERRRPKSNVKAIRERSSSDRGRGSFAGKMRDGELRVTTTLNGQLSWAWLEVDGRRIGSTPNTVALPPGRHTVRLQREGFKTLVHEVDISPGETVRLPMKLEK